MTGHVRLPVHGTNGGEAYWGPGDRYVFHVTGAESSEAMFALDCLVGPAGDRRRTATLQRTSSSSSMRARSSSTLPTRRTSYRRARRFTCPRAQHTATETSARVTR